MVTAVRTVHERCAAQASRAVNINLTLLNWLIGAYVHEYELRGADRARYGEGLFIELADQLSKANVSNCGKRQLYRYARFYRLYPEIVGTLSPQLAGLDPPGLEKVGTASPLLRTDPKELVSKLSYSRIEQLVELEEDLERGFYEAESMRTGWSVRQLKRQIGALYFQRSGLSKDPQQLAALTQASAEAASPALNIRDPYIFEFLGVKAKEVMAESDLEDALLDKLQEFLLELGHGFCFEARQKRILIGDTHGFIDLVFYHRIWKCHVLLELKVAAFSHEHLGQLNTYVSWYKRNMMTTGDNPPVGLLLCTRKDHTLVEYALADLPNQLFVSKYQLELPSKQQIQEFIDAQMGVADKRWGVFAAREGRPLPASTTTASSPGIRAFGEVEPPDRTPPTGRRPRRSGICRQGGDWDLFPG